MATERHTMWLRCATLLCYGHCDLWIHSFYVFVLLLPLRHFISQRYSFGKFSRFIRHHHRIVQCAMVATYKVYVEVLGLLFYIISTFKRWEWAHLTGTKVSKGRCCAVFLVIFLDILYCNHIFESFESLNCYSSIRKQSTDIKKTMHWLSGQILWKS